MQFKSVKGYSVTSQLGTLLAAIGTGLILMVIAQLLIAIIVVPAGTPMDKWPVIMHETFANPVYKNYVRIAQIVNSFFMMCFPALMFTLMVNGRNPLWLGFSSLVNIRQIVLGTLLMIVANVFASTLADFSKWILVNFPDLNAVAKSLETDYEQSIMSLARIDSWWDFGISLFIMALLPALFEELLFRGAIQNFLTRWWKSPWVAILVTAALFSFIHLSIYLFLTRLVLGICLGYLFFSTRNIWVSIIAHFLNNVVAVYQLFSLSSKNNEINLRELDPTMPWWAAAIALIVLIGLAWWLYLISTENRRRIIARELAEGASPQDPNHLFIA